MAVGPSGVVRARVKIDGSGQRLNGDAVEWVVKKVGRSGGRKLQKVTLRKSCCGGEL